jgi:hypothetical protein
MADQSGSRNLTPEEHAALLARADAAIATSRQLCAMSRGKLRECEERLVQTRTAMFRRLSPKDQRRW